MDSRFYQPLGLSELLPRYSWLEPLIQGARVLEIGAVGSTGGRSAAGLRQRGARFVLALDDSPGAVAAARQSQAADADLHFLTGRPEDLGEEVFDLVLVADASAFVHEPQRLEAIARLAGAQGRAVFALRNMAGASLAQVAGAALGETPPTFGEMLARLRECFASVEVFTQSAFAGYQIAPAHGGGEPEVSVDGSLLDAEECAYFLAVCGRRPWAPADSVSLVALPASPLAVAGAGREDLLERLKLAEVAAEQARGVAQRALARQSELERQVASLTEKLEQVQSAFAKERARLEAEARSAEMRRQ